MKEYKDKIIIHQRYKMHKGSFLLYTRIKSYPTVYKYQSTRSSTSTAFGEGGDGGDKTPLYLLLAMVTGFILYRKK